MNECRATVGGGTGGERRGLSDTGTGLLNLDSQCECVCWGHLAVLTVTTWLSRDTVVYMYIISSLRGRQVIGRSWLHRYDEHFVSVACTICNIRASMTMKVACRVKSSHLHHHHDAEEKRGEVGIWRSAVKGRRMAEEALHRKQTMVVLTIRKDAFVL